jgi:hypothetical protein
LIAADRKHRNRYFFDLSAAWHRDCTSMRVTSEKKR